MKSAAEVPIFARLREIFLHTFTYFFNFTYFYIRLHTFYILFTNFTYYFTYGPIFTYFYILLHTFTYAPFFLHTQSVILHTASTYAERVAQARRKITNNFTYFYIRQKYVKLRFYRLFYILFYIRTNFLHTQLFYILLHTSSASRRRDARVRKKYVKICFTYFLHTVSPRAGKTIRVRKST